MAKRAKRLSQNQKLLLGGVLLLLLVKFFLPFFLYDTPLGYDAGIYRYLFVRHSHGFPPFWLGDVDPWAKGHPLGLFFFSTILMRIGVPVDWLIGWIWNLFPVVLVGSFAWVMAKREKNYLVGLFTLVAGLLSVAYFDGFAAMYWKTFASLLWCALAFRAFEKKSWLAIVYGMLAVATHNQTGLLFGLTLISWIALPFIPCTRSTEKAITKSMSTKDILIIVSIAALTGIAGFLTYLPVLHEAILEHLPALLGETEAAGGSFPPALFYLQTEAILLLFGAYGFYRSVQKERWTPWQLAVIWSFLFVALRLIFYRRFFLQLDFFLLPFAAMAMRDAWMKFKGTAMQSLFVAILVVQLCVSAWVMQMRKPLVDDVTLHNVIEARDTVPAGAFILGLENESVVALRGWLPDRPLGGPGLFDVFWIQADWEKFLLGTHEERVALLQTLPQPTYLFVSTYFNDYYGDYAAIFLKDECFEATAHNYLYRVTCTSPTAQ